MRPNRLPVFSALLVTAALIFFGHHATGQRAGAGAPTTVVTVDMDRVLAGLNERAVLLADFRAMQERINDEKETKRLEIEGLESRIKELAETDRAARDPLREQYDLAVLEFQTWAQVQLEELDIEEALLLQSLYMSIQSAIADLCSAEGYDIVLVDDSKEELVYNPQSKTPRSAQVKQQLGSRRLVYASEAVDITDDVIARMNNAFNANPNANP